ALSRILPGRGMGVLPKKGPTMNQRLLLGYIAAAALTGALLAALCLLPARSSGRDQPRTSIKIGSFAHAPDGNRSPGGLDSLKSILSFGIIIGRLHALLTIAKQPR